MADYSVRAQVPAEDCFRVRLDAGLSRKTEEAARIGLANSVFAVTVFCRNEAVGVGRVIGNGGCFQIVDVAVLPDHHRKGVGKLGSSWTR